MEVLLLIETNAGRNLITQPGLSIRAPPETGSKQTSMYYTTTQQQQQHNSSFQKLQQEFRLLYSFSTRAIFMIPRQSALRSLSLLVSRFRQLLPIVLGLVFLS